MANTIAFRRRKGTALMLEELARSVTDWPARMVEFKAQPEKIDEAAITHVDRLKTLVDTCRQLRGEMGVSPGTRMPTM